MDKVLRTFAAPIRIRVGQIVDASGWRNAGFLRRRGYLQPVEGDIAPDPEEKPFKRRPMPRPELEETPAEIAAVEDDTPQPVEIELPEFSPAGMDPLEVAASAPVVDAGESVAQNGDSDEVEYEATEEPEEPQRPRSKMTKAQLVALAESMGVKVTPDTMTNKQIIEAIEAAEVAG